MYYVYAHINPITKKIFYIGKGKGRRSSSETGRNIFWRNTVRKYGYAIVYLIDGLDHDQAIEIEKQYIQKHGLRQDGGSLVNMTLGGEFGRHGYKMTAAERIKVSNRTRGNKIWLGKKHAKSTKAKMAKAAKGRVKSEAEKLKISHANKGRKLSEGAIKNISDGHKGLRASEETKVKQRESKIGNKNPNYGKKTWNFGIPRTAEEKKKMSDAKVGIPQSEERKTLSLAALEKAHIKRKEKSLQVKCLNTGKVWKNKWDCINDLKITDSKFKDMVRTDRGIQKLQYIK